MTSLKRILVIIWVISKYRLDQLIPLTLVPWYVRALLMLAPWHFFPTPKKLSRGERIRLALQELGPIFIKFGQILSTRRDLMPDDIAEELKLLQDRVPAFSSAIAKSIIENSLKTKIDDVFDEFSEEALASASVAQVHTAKLKNGDEVVVKVIRPNLVPTISKDISVMKLMASLLETYWSEGKRLHPKQIVEDYEHTIYDELDLQKEAANGSQLRRNFENSELLYVPKIYWDFTRTSVLVMERISGIPVADVDELLEQKTNMKILAERGVEIFFTQVFRDSFFHADMHPGNIFVSRQHPQSPQYISVDFGIIGSLTENDQIYLARNLLAFFNRDYRQVAQLHIDSGWIPKHTRVNEFEAAIRSVCEPIFEKPLSEISFGHFLLRLFQVARRFDMEVQPQLVLLQKTLLNIEGLGRQLYPELDLWQTALPYLEGWMKNRVAPPNVLKNIQLHAADWAEQTRQLPQLMFHAISQLQSAEQHRLEQSQQLHQLQNELHNQAKAKRNRMIGLVLVSAAGLLSFPAASELITQMNTPTALLLAGGIYLLALKRY
ncbi:ubiquinone biosynthesis regulatory protein kinase UbiB [Litoribrevibacter euphylliae]|uniref:Probable protein kinase UbiB n=1 Tax=Litoribrevibacter euphylliae TaxID=1834034 RepID=A0ABV7HEU6_9GAMM